MKTYQDLLSMTRNELNQWYINQSRNPFKEYNLYYMPTTAEHDGGVLVLSEPPANPDYIKSVAISGFYTVDQHMIMLQNGVLPKLPILSAQ